MDILVDMKELLSSAKDGDLEARYELAERFRKRAALDIDAQQAAAWCRSTAVEGHVESQYRLARCLSTGRGLEKDVEVAVSLYQAASAQGHINAQTRLGRCYETGIGIDRDLDLALDSILTPRTAATWTRCTTSAKSMRVEQI